MSRMRIGDGSMVSADVAGVFDAVVGVDTTERVAGKDVAAVAVVECMNGATRHDATSTSPPSRRGDDQVCSTFFIFGRELLLQRDGSGGRADDTSIAAAAGNREQCVRGIERRCSPVAREEFSLD